MMPAPPIAPDPEAGRIRFFRRLQERNKSGRSQCIRLGLGRNPALVLHWPPARRNKYQLLLYSAAKNNGYIPFPIFELDLLEDLEWNGEIIFHAHWFARLHKGCASEAEAIAASRRAFAILDRFRRRTGARLVWTAHNVMPHGTDLIYAAVDMRRRIIAEFDAIHLMAENHREILEDAFGLPLGNYFVVPHMTYDGVYPDTVSRSEARQQLELPKDCFVFGSFGSLQRYKGLDTLIQAFRQAAGTRADAVLVLAGAPVDPDYVQRLQSLRENDERIIIHARDVPDDEVQLYMKAADVMVYPYQDTLNSGAAAAALTFGVPIIGSDTTAFRNLASPLVRLYRQGSSDDLAAVMRMTCRSRSTGPGSSKHCPHIELLRPETISRQFFSHLEELMNQERQPCLAS